MEKAESLEAFYRKKMGLLPSDTIRNIGHFNVFSMDDYKGMEPPFPVPYSRKDFYKISLIEGRNTVYYADKTISVENNMLFCQPAHSLQLDAGSQKPRRRFLCVHR